MLQPCSGVRDPLVALCEAIGQAVTPIGHDAATTIVASARAIVTACEALARQPEQAQALYQVAQAARRCAHVLDELVASLGSASRASSLGPLVYAYETQVSTVAAPDELRILFVGADPPTQSRQVYPAGVGHRLSDAVASVHEDATYGHLTRMSYASNIGLRRANFAAELALRKPTLLVMCMHYERADAMDGKARKLLHFAESDGSGAADGTWLGATLRDHNAALPQSQRITCVVLMACACHDLGSIVANTMGGEVRVLVTTRTLYQSQAEWWASGFFGAVCRGASVVDAMDVAQATVNKECPSTAVSGGFAVNLHIKPGAPLFVCYGLQGKPVDVAADVAVLRVAAPPVLGVLLVGADPPSQSRAVYPAGVGHGVGDAVEEASLDPHCGNMMPLTYGDNIGMRRAEFAWELEQRKPTLLMLCMHHEKVKGWAAGQSSRPVLHFAESDGSGTCDGAWLGHVLSRHNARQRIATQRIGCVVLMACACQGLGPVMSREMGSQVLVLVTTRTLYQSQAEAWAAGFVGEVCRGRSIQVAMDGARARVGKDCQAVTSGGGDARSAQLHIDATDPLFVCYRNGRPLAESSTGGIVLRKAVAGLHDSGWERVRRVLRQPYPTCAPTALGLGTRRSHGGIDVMYTPMTVRAGHEGRLEAAPSRPTDSVQRCTLSEVWDMASQVEEGGEAVEEMHAVNKWIIVEGVAGMGKSTLAHMVGARQGIQGWPEHMRAAVVVNLSLVKRAWQDKAHGSRLQQQGPTLSQVLKWQFGVGRVEARELGQWLRSHRKEVVWVLDSYDEVENRGTGMVTLFDRWLDRLMDREVWTDTIEYAVVMTRPGRKKTEFKGALHVALEPWSEASIKDYVERFAQGLELDEDGLCIQGSGSGEWQAGYQRQAFVKRALEVLVDNVSLPIDFAGVPFVCEITCRVVHANAALSQQVDLCTLYSAMVKLLWKHEEMMHRPNTDAVRCTLSACALYTYKNGNTLPGESTVLPLHDALETALEEAAEARAKEQFGVVSMTPSARKLAKERILHECFEAVKVCWALRGGGFVHKTIMEFLVAHALVDQGKVVLKRDLLASIRLEASGERMVLVFVAGLLRAECEHGAKAEAAKAASMSATLTKRVTKLMVDQYVGLAEMVDAPGLDASYERRESLRVACGASLVMQVVAVLASPKCNALVYKAVIQGLRTHKPLERVLLEPAARFGNVAMVEYLVQKRNMSAVEALRAAASAGQNGVVKWCVEKGRVDAVTVLRLQSVASSGNHRLLGRLLRGKVNGVVNHWTKDQLCDAVVAAGRGGHGQAFRELIEVGGVGGTVALQTAWEANPPINFVCRVCVEEYEAPLPTRDVGKVLGMVVADATWTWMLDAMLDTVVEVDLWNKSINDEAAVAFAHALRANYTVTKVNLNRNEVEAKGGVSLANALKVNSTLTSLDLHANSIAAQGGQALGDALVVNTTLTHLNLSGNAIGVEGGIVIAEALTVNTTLLRLNLFANAVGSDGCVAIACALKANNTLTTLDLERNRIIGAEGCVALGNALRANETLTKLTMSHNKIEDAGCVALADALKVNNTLQELILVYTQVKDVGGEAIAAALTVNTTLKVLDMTRNLIGVGGGVAIGHALMRNTTLKQLFLKENKIGLEGGVVIVDAMNVNTTLSWLDLIDSGVSDPDLTRIRSMFSRRQHQEAAEPAVSEPQEVTRPRASTDQVAPDRPLPRRVLSCRALVKAKCPLPQRPSTPKPVSKWKTASLEGTRGRFWTSDAPPVFKRPQGRPVVNRGYMVKAKHPRPQPPSSPKPVSKWKTASLEGTRGRVWTADAPPVFKRSQVRPVVKRGYMVKAKHPRPQPPSSPKPVSKWKTASLEGTRGRVWTADAPPVLKRPQGRPVVKRGDKGTVVVRKCVKKVARGRGRGRGNDRVRSGTTVVKKSAESVKVESPTLVRCRDMTDTFRGKLERSVAQQATAAKHGEPNDA